MAVLVFGASGRLGRVLSQVDGVIGVTRASCDLRRPADVAKLVETTRPTAVINAAGISDPFYAERNESLAFAVNATAPTVMAETCAMHKIPFVHITSDQVFDGMLPMPYVPADPVNPQSALGRTQSAGELGILNARSASAIIRTSCLIDDIQDCLRQLSFPKDKSNIFIPENARIGPTPTWELARATLTIAAALAVAPEKAGVYHFTGQEDIELSVMAQTLLQATHSRERLCVVDHRVMNFPAHLLGDRRLDCRTTKAVFGLERPNWREGLFGSNTQGHKYSHAV